MRIAKTDRTQHHLTPTQETTPPALGIATTAAAAVPDTAITPTIVVFTAPLADATGATNINTPRKALLALCLACVLVALLILGVTPSAFADDNQVNPQQLPDSSFIYDTSILDLSTADSYHDNQTVQVVGEVVGDSVKADAEGNYRWITLIAQDPTTNATIMVYMSARDAEKIDSFGKYGVTGTSLQVRGTFHLACSDHEGLSDVHADHVSVVKRGTSHPDEFDPQAFIPGGIAIVVGLITLIVFYRVRERRR